MAEADVCYDIDADLPILTYGPLVIYEGTGAQSFGELLTAHRPAEGQWRRHMSPKQVVSPAVS